MPGEAGRREVWRREAESAAAYDGGVGDWVTARETRAVLDLLNRTTGTILDFPCGSGRLTRFLSEAGHRVVGADLLPDMAAFTREIVGPRVAQADIFTPPFRPESFQAILAVRIFFHYPDQAALLAALAALLAPGGRLIFDTLNPVSTRRLAAPLLDLARNDPRRRLIFSPPGRIQALAQRLGLRPVARRGLHLLPTRTYRRLPGWLVQGLYALEQRVPEDFRVLTFWAFDRPGRDEE